MRMIASEVIQNAGRVGFGI
ncbi:Protein of unknown function [Bacillus cereus]|nr:Protein of unknown function [Bacillus cereus]